MRDKVHGVCELSKKVIAITQLAVSLKSQFSKVAVSYLRYWGLIQK
jgi:hypothetical protein